ncbi:hypothetical protein KH5H1_00300 [Corallococcus caeni]|uniref:hypothetical protein n=1 Tax=Corallococcus caeni TaxID=3082388 RepID=UPI0029573C16|nr:hypothetical protein KH5H1_00300 [Corallococcus sp. KH5-1]
MTNQTRRLSALLRRLEIELLRKCAQETLGERFRPRRSKNDYVNDIQSAHVPIQHIAAALQKAAGTWDGTTNAPPLIQWNESVLGPLGMTEARQAREVGDAAELVDSLLLEALSDAHLDFVATQVSPDFAQAAQTTGADLAIKRMTLAQACLHGSDEELMAAVNNSIPTLGPLKTDPEEPYIVLDWLVTPWGLLSLPHEHTEDAIASILCERGGVRLNAILPEIPGASTKERCAIYTLQKGPSLAIDEFFSTATIWEFLQAKGLHLPIDADQHMLRGLMLQYVGLRPAPRPDGLLRQYSELLHQPPPRTSSDNSDARSWRELRRFERHWENNACALIASATAELELSLKDWLSVDGIKSLADRQLTTRKQRPIRELTLGQKRRLFEQVLTDIEKTPQFAHALKQVGRTASEMRAAFCGPSMELLISARNELAHPKEEVPPNWNNIRLRLIDALRPLATPAAQGLVTIAAPVVRLVEERTDATGWTRCEFETETGEAVVASLGGQSLAIVGAESKNFHLVARSKTAVVRPILISN